VNWDGNLHPSEAVVYFGDAVAVRRNVLPARLLSVGKEGAARAEWKQKSPVYQTCGVIAGDEVRRVIGSSDQ
jgi:hypothetical protein